MKISLVVASGVHQGKAIAVPGAQFLIGRDEGCHLRPASPAISKKHCLLFVRDGKAFARDLESTNGTFVNDEPVKGERELADGDRLRVGPLDFSVTLAPGSKADSTPLPDALKAVAPKPGETKPAGQGATPGPTPKPETAPTPPAGDEDPDKIAAMLLSMSDDDSGEVPGGSTVMDLPSVEGAQGQQPAKPEEEKKKKGVPTGAEMSAAASEILRRYMRRPK
jgi:pSer/pThr/pTyr-binding forkhead associated (FHA) protein